MARNQKKKEASNPQNSKTWQWWIEKVIVPILLAVIPGYFLLLSTGVIESPFSQQAILTPVSTFETPIIMSLTAEAATNIHATSVAATETSIALLTEEGKRNTSASQTIEASFVTQTFESLLLTQSVPVPTEVKPIRYEHTVEVGETLSEISKDYFIQDFYAVAIGRANCNPSPKANDKLIIRYFYPQFGDTIDSIATRFGGKPSFLRHINNLNPNVVSPPFGQIFILTGSCSDG